LAGIPASHRTRTLGCKSKVAQQTALLMQEQPAREERKRAISFQKNQNENCNRRRFFELAKV
jgi:hypothetical protein